MVRELVQSVTGYPGLFVFCAISGLLIPLPEDFSLIYAGVRVHGGHWSWAATLAVAMSGVLARDVAAWGIGRWSGPWLLTRRWVQVLFGRKKLARARRMVRHHVPSAILAGRFLVGFRAPVFMVSGAMGVPLRSFALWDIVGLVVAVPLTITLGYAFGEPIADTVFWVLQRTRVAVGVGIGAAVTVAVWRWASQRGADPPSLEDDDASIAPPPDAPRAER